MLARVGRFPLISPLHFALSCTYSVFRPSDFMSPLTHSPYVYLDLPWHFAPTTSKFQQEDHHYRFNVRFFMLARVGQLSPTVFGSQLHGRKSRGDEGDRSPQTLGKHTFSHRKNMFSPNFFYTAPPPNLAADLRCCQIQNLHPCYHLAFTSQCQVALTGMPLSIDCQVNAWLVPCQYLQ